MVTSSSLLHPVRLRIVQVLRDGEAFTTHQIRELLPDIPIATLYRHIATLVDAGVVEIADERPVRGTSEKIYRIAPTLANPTAEDLRALTPDELLTVFTVFTSGTIRDMDAYLHAGSPELVDDRVNFAQADFWASDEELDDFLGSVTEALLRLRQNTQRDGRRPRRLTTILMPRDTPGQEES
ncbi:helix-turn-helix domain-containing protein [Corynebacterium glyciniphilum]|uniref:helix-turn-helix domain-containing protein n=1 Tax=Corynebacterium glyciniphilum TaxID=1404244 RepID=UPI00264A4E79|nr:helix-turn-helix domain-containing protein [Corynebacterium glyciniphilum]MDN5683531.1 helix-turn-helix domain-containing protein [Corynebacterium glyciniphilum]MDN6705256.1 helix-turn-helix domain-containing protein [Corynebacterium glyciniphilum]